jgi:hydroxyethylthiazole kinase-like uncharacterized protein yjeF
MMGLSPPRGLTVSGHELLTTEEMGRADRLAVEAGTPSLALMEAAGRAVAAAADALGTAGASVVVACGPGSNGGDGFVAARVLREQGYRVRVGLLGNREGLRGDAAVMAGRWGGAIEALSPETLAEADVIIDAIFGAGLSRALDGVAADAVAAINGAGKPVIAVDVPSGLDGTTGQAAGQVVQATATVTFFRRKPGHLLLPGRLRAPSPTGRPCGSRTIRACTWALTSTRAGTPLWCRGQPRALVRRAWGRGRRCVSAQASSPWSAARRPPLSTPRTPLP